MVIIDLSGPEGNAYALMARAKGWAKELDLDFEQIQSEMTSGDYDHLIETLRKYFGEYVEFEK